MTELILNMILIVFAVFGLYCLVRLTFDAVDVPEGLALSFTVASREALRTLPERLCAARQRLSPPKSRIRVLVPFHLYEDIAFREELSAALLFEEAEVIPYQSFPDGRRI